MWLTPDPNQALSLAVRLCAVGQLIGLLELFLARRELSDSGFLDWSMIGNLSPVARTRLGGAIRRRFRRLPRPAFAVALVADAAVAAALLAWPAAWPLIGLAVALQVIVLKRHHLTIDGSDQMMLVVLVTCLVGRIGSDAVSARAAVTFLAAELVLAYAVAGFAKASSRHWRSGVAFSVIAQTRMYGQPAVARLIRGHPALGTAAGWSVVVWESLAFVALTAPRPLLVAMLLAGLGFHAGCAVVMGLNRFIWAFVASYPALLCTNAAVRAQLGAATADRVTIVAAGLGALVIAVAGAKRPALAALQD
jgi:hypothetical protein